MHSYENVDPQMPPERFSRQGVGEFDEKSWHCQTNLTGPAKGADLKRSGCKLTPFRERGSAVLFEDVARVEVTVEVEVVVD